MLAQKLGPKLAFASLERMRGLKDRTPKPDLLPRTQHSMLLPILFQGLKRQHEQSNEAAMPRPGLRVLDLGPPKSSTVEFFSTYKCKLIFADLLAAPCFQLEGFRDDPKWPDRLRSALTNDTDVQFDLCLFWDVLNFMDEATLELFNEVLAPLMHDQTQAHGFCLRSTELSVQPTIYGIESLNEISQDPHHAWDLESYPHPTSHIRRLLTNFEVPRGTLLRDGRIEILLEALPEQLAQSQANQAKPKSKTKKR